MISGDRYVSFLIRPAMLRACDDAARANGISISSLFRTYIDAGLQRDGLLADESVPFRPHTSRRRGKGEDNPPAQHDDMPAANGVKHV